MPPTQASRCLWWLACRCTTGTRECTGRCEGLGSSVPEKPQDRQVDFSADNFPIPHETRLSKLFR